MRKFFIADDGSVFDTEYACIAHEEKLRGLRLKDAGVYMWDAMGDRATEVDGAFFVFLEGKDSARVFLDLNAADPSYAKGIEEGDQGFFFWNYEEERYISIGTPQRISRIFIDLSEILRKQNRC